MAAHPKNKVTRVEQGKRRHGNTPKLLRDTKTARIAPHKVGLFTRFLNVFSAKTTNVTKKTVAPVKAEIKTEAEAKAVTPGLVAGKVDGTIAKAPTARTARPSAVVKKTTRTQHKGG